MGSDLLAMAMIVGPSLGYLPQLKTLLTSRVMGQFSVNVCYILLVSSWLRILFWYGKPFDTALYYQSAVMILTQMALLGTILGRILPFHRAKRGVMSSFWTVSLITILAYWNYTVQKDGRITEGIGSLALFIEAMLPVPQYWSIRQTGSAEGVSIVMVLAWTLGDAFKSYYYISNQAPIQFLLCGLFQLVVDLLICYQVASTSSRPKVA